MTLLQAIRRSTLIVRSVLAWFVMSMAVAVAAPVVQPQSSMLVCSASGAVKLVDSSGEDGVAAGHHTLDCVLCLALNAPPAVVADFAILPLAPAVHEVHPSRNVWVFRSDATLAARAPPALI
jgi:hypothetical protein